MTTMRVARVMVVTLMLGGSVRAQSINVSFGHPTGAPASSYAAAGLPGVWNSIEGQASPQITYPLVGLDGGATGVTLYQSGSTTLMIANDPTVNGDDANLLNSALIIYDATQETCLFDNGLS